MEQHKKLAPYLDEEVEIAAHRTGNNQILRGTLTGLYQQTESGRWMAQIKFDNDTMGYPVDDVKPILP